MLKRLKLTNFRRHESLELNFEAGLIAVRGANEAGKTTVQEAIAYALFGATALRQSFAEVVTWGKPESSLQVELVVSDGTLDLTFVRRKAGAEVRDAGGAVRCVGQKECTRYGEQMLGASADVAPKLMLASQGALRGALEGGPAAAAELIEDLADFNLLDRLCHAIANNRCTGRTVGVEATIAAHRATLEQLDAEPAYDPAPREAEIVAANAALGAAYESQSALDAELRGLDAAGARQRLQGLQQAGRDLEALAPQIKRAAAQAGREVTQPASAANIDSWRQAQAEVAQWQERRRAYERVTAFADTEAFWDDSEGSFRVAYAEARDGLSAAAQELNEKRVELAKAVAKRITEKACAFCGKDLSDVPEVLRRNIEVDEQVQALQGAIHRLSSLVAERTETIAEYDALERDAKKWLKSLQPLMNYVTLADDRYPPTWAWAGTVPLDSVDAPDYAAMIRGAEMELGLYQRELGTRDAAAAQLVDLQAHATQLRGHQAVLQETAARDGETVARADALTTEIRAIGVSIAELASKLQMLRIEAEHSQRVESMRQEQREGVAEMLATNERMLAEMRFNNALLKKLREARGPISDKLWSIVLAAVSLHFSQIRGVQSVITRSDSGFKCDGQAVQGLSGSTLDALGLAIRVALTKTFLPDARFMMLDEPGAACDDERETNMLGLVASSGFDQVLLVTHSPIADSFASQVVVL